ncbi:MULTISPECIES: TDP-N-acetylfucosamine:lipid II N-acetylfucosaminyltransferase [Olivibacter]|jgi:hypothetical protein|uniref:TDP-N-acetylfucosamine:lipid II N-acetylfucosaminyltransferase n=1 Tax=Olivibacter oleidegradans TaxID=760123 RepID=A0ABV6HGV1_9SPHI|nr:MULTISPECIES: TDP-N-acetylfucosamine:lipid II N-acetylfucosaminyltransferase [Olivibacter]MDM8176748.1 TDP-N-acetylfucosamine:lipid II N-acetylfucosaminyltransferase [Olivibacter sp. 47]QEL00566.1 hypothetical protein FKG96_06990 [Olivibacter sp. LS-1]
MNLHILDDEKFFDPFVQKLEALGLLGNNIFVVKECGSLKYIKRQDLIYCRMCDSRRIGNTRHYAKVFIHCFTRDLFEWVYDNDFQELNWIIWGKDLYLTEDLFEKQTKHIVKKIKDRRSAIELRLTRARHFFLNIDLSKVYTKVANVLTWIKPEYDYAVTHIKGLKANHLDFAYMFEYDAEFIVSQFLYNRNFKHKKISDFKIVLGNSGVASNNHLDALEELRQLGFEEIVIPLSYGNEKYIKILQKEIERKPLLTKITYLTQFLTLHEYLTAFYKSDIFVSNSIRPLGMGNIWIALLLGKLVFMNPKNLVFDFLKSMGLQVFAIGELESVEDIAQTIDVKANVDIAIDFLSTARIDAMYRNLFSATVRNTSELHLCTSTL